MRVLPFAGAVALASCLALTGCRKKVEPQETPGATDESTVTEENENGSVTWEVTPEGKVRGKVKTKDGKPITKDITGTLVWPGDTVDNERDVNLDEDGNLVAEGPPLEEDLTQIDYNLTVEGNPWNGVLHVPKGGTRAIDDDAKAAASLTVPAGKRGPNGGVIQYIGGEPVEMVADKDTKEVRVYVLNRDYNVIDPGERTVRLAYGAQYPGMQVLVREPGANYYVGPWYPDYNPYRITLAMTVGVETHVGIIGWTYGARLSWGVPAPLFFVGTYGWAPSVVFSAGYGFGWGWGWGWGYRGGYYVRGIEAVRVGGRVSFGPGVRGHGHGDNGVRDHGAGHGHGDHGGGHGDHGGGHGDHGGGHGDHGGGHGPDHGGGHTAGGGHASPGGGGHMASPGGGHASAPSRGGGSRPSGGGKRR